jgi:hypothetical protein
MILGIDARLLFGVVCLLMGFGTSYMAWIGLKDVRNQTGEFSDRYQAAFGGWGINRFLVRFNSWTRLLGLVSGGPLFFLLAAWLLLGWSLK